MITTGLLKHNWKGVLTAIVVGVVAAFIKGYSNSYILDPLLMALVFGIILRSLINFKEDFTLGFKLTPLLFIPIGVILYGAVNLNFVKFASVNPGFIFIVFIVFLVYLTSVFLLASLLDINNKTTYLIATGSAVCGASAIAITSDAIDAEPDDVSNSLISVFIAAFLGLFVFLPFLSVVLNMTAMDYSIMAGTVLQFTGFVKAAIANFSPAGLGSDPFMALGLSIKAVRYMALLFLIPIFASFIKGRLYVPWYLWGFLIAGLVFSFMPNVSDVLKPYFKPIQVYFWSIAMAAIGLNANLKSLFSKNGLKALATSFISFAVATSVFLGLYLLLRNLII